MAEQDSDLQNVIRDAVAGPQQVSGDQGSMTQRPIDDLIKADKYLAAKRAAGRGGLRGIAFVKIVPPGNG